MLQPPKKRNRSKRPVWTFSSVSSAEWKLAADLVKWAQDSPEFRQLITILVNDKQAVLDSLPGVASENRLLGRHEGYEAVRLHLLSLAEGPAPVEQADRAPTYEPDQPTTVESDFVTID